MNRLWQIYPLEVYWKIGIHWVTTLCDLLTSPFDDRSCRILLNFSSAKIILLCIVTDPI